MFQHCVHMVASQALSDKSSQAFSKYLDYRTLSFDIFDKQFYISLLRFLKSCKHHYEFDNNSYFLLCVTRFSWWYNA